MEKSWSRTTVLVFILILYTAGTGAAEPASVGATFGISDMPMLKGLDYSFESSRFIPGKGRGDPEEWFGNIGLALKYAQDNYWASDAYSARGYTVKKGQIKSSDGTILSDELYSISPPDFGEDYQFSASGNDVFYRFPDTDQSRSYILYRVLKPEEFSSFSGGEELLSYKNNFLAILGRYTSSGDVQKLDISGFSSHKSDIRIFMGREEFSPFRKFSETVQGAGFKDTDLGRLNKFIFSLEGSAVPHNSYEGYQYGPSTVYGQNARFYPFIDTQGRVSMVWQDTESSRLYLSIINPDLSMEQRELPLSLGILATLCHDPETGDLYYLTIAEGEDPRMILVKMNPANSYIRKAELSYRKDDFNIHVFNDNVASMVYAEGFLWLNIGRTMQKSSDGLNHQGAIAAVFNAKDLSLVRNYGQTSGHSFDSRINHDGRQALILNLGDNYPRGIIFHRFSPDDNWAGGKVIYTFKTHHGDVPSPYRKGSNGKPLPPGKWSNDNYTYTELGGVEKGLESYVVAFASEKSHRNDLAVDNLNEPRNIGMVQVSTDFTEKEQSGNVVSSEVVISRGSDSPEFGFYTFDGWFSAQKYTGVIWLTDYRDETKENATHIKLVKVDKDRFLILWEKWTENDFLSSYCILVNEQGKRLSGEIELGSNIRLPRNDSVLFQDNTLVWFTSQGRKLEVNVFHLEQ